MKERFLLLILLFAFVLSLASFTACGQVSSSGENSKVSSSVVTDDSSDKSESSLKPSDSSSIDNPDDNPSEKESYEITLDSSITGGSVTVGVSNLNNVKEGQTVTLSNTPNKGYKFECYSINGAEQTGNTFVMPSGGVYLSAKFSKIDYTVITFDYDGGTITANKSVANYGDTIILSYSAQDGYLFKGFTVNQDDNVIKVNNNSFVMPDGNVTVTGEFELQKFTVTLVNPSDGGTLSANGHNISFNADYGTVIELSVSLTGGSYFSSYKINGVSQTNNTFVLKENTTVEVVFIRELNGLSNFAYDAYLNNGGNSSGNVSISGNSVTNTQGKFPFVYTQMQGDFYYETEITFNAVYNNDSYPKAGIGIECNSDILFFFIDAENFGVDKKVAVTPARGTLFGQNDFAWDWHGGSDEWSYEFKSDYTNGNYIKLGVLKVGGLFRFFVEDKYVFSVWAPNMDDTLFLGLFAFNTGYNAKNAKYATSKTVLNNVKAYYGLLKDNNPNAIVVDGTVKDWGENLATYYGYTTGDSVSYFYSGAFKGKDAVYTVFKARVSSIITSYSDWKNNTNVEVYVNGKHFYADFSGHMSGITDIDYGYYQDVDGSDCYILTIEAKIPYSEIGEGFSSSSDIEMRFAFCLTEQLREYFLDDDELYWIEVGCKDLTVKTDGIDYEQAIAPTDKVVKTTNRMCADPYILLVGDTYYMYGTTDNSNGFRVYTSTDLSSWTDRGYCFNKSYSKPVGTTNFWAPEVKYNASTGKYVMFYSAGKYMGGSEPVAKSGVATSDSPLGPFYDVNNGTPMLYADSNNMASIDATCFVDDDGQAYIFYSKDCSFNVIENYHNGKTCHVSQTWGAKLDSTWTQVISDPVLISTPEQAWEFADGESDDMWLWNEGPFVFKNNGKYYLTFSANYYARENYAVGVAIATSPLGTYVKYAGNPIVRKDLGKTSGTGHGMMFVDKNGVQRYVFHTFRDVNNEDPDTRVALIARLWFCDGIPTIEYKNW